MELKLMFSQKYFKIYNLLAEIPGVAQDSIRNEGTPEINYGII
jgi:hypothetical protein